jgi:predicted TIM-barrel fold metal-dependent hydrolase
MTKRLSALKEPQSGRPDYCDHTGLWEKELKSWVPGEIFDAHVHTGRKEDVESAFTEERLKHALSTFSYMPVEEMDFWHRSLFSGKKITGVFAFPFPLREVCWERSNGYIIELMRRDSRVRGFLWTDPRDVGRNIRLLRSAEKSGVRFFGVKPYFDILGGDNFKTNPEAILPSGLLDLVNTEKLVIMLHTTLKGVGEERVRAHINHITEKYQSIKIILAHMGRFLGPRDFEAFMRSGLPANPAVFLETSSAASAEVYQMAFSRKDLHKKILFGSDIPFGLITGVEFWSETSGAIFRTRDKYTWSEEGSYGHDLTYNVWHVVKALKDALAPLDLSDADRIKKDVFFDNAMRLISSQK